jgi:hypothetical protein
VRPSLRCAVQGIPDFPGPQTLADNGNYPVASPLFAIDPMTGVGKSAVNRKRFALNCLVNGTT